MSHKLSAILLLVVLNISGCCSYSEEDFEFSESELSLIHAYKEGDAIIFNNLEIGEVDTIRIVKIGRKENRKCGWLMAPPASNYLWIEIEHSNGNPYTFFSIHKQPQKKETSFSLTYHSFLSSHSSELFGHKHHDTLTINGRLITNYFKIAHGYPERIENESGISYLIWTEKEGLIAYQYTNGLWLTKVASW